MDKIPNPESSLEYLKGKHVFLIMTRGEKQEEVMTLRALVEEILPGNRLKIIYEGNDNLEYDNRVEEVSSVAISKVLFSNKIEVEEEGVKHSKEDLGKWRSWKIE